jgi:RHS repeat-associated protein
LRKHSRRPVDQAVRPIIESLEGRVYLNGLTAILNTSNIQAVQFQSFDGGLITDAAKGGSAYVPAGANVSIAGIQDASLTVAGKLALTSAASQVNSLNIMTGGTLDLTNDKLIVNYGSSSDPNFTIRSDLASGYNGGGWNGTGIDSSSAAGNSAYALAYADGADGVVSGLPSGQVEVLYTLSGDADLNSVVNGTDFGILAGNFGKSVSNWDQGDFNYDGVVNGSDFGSLAANFGKGAAGQSDYNYTSPEQYVASFTDTAGLSLTSLTTSINWGDGTAATPGAIVADGGSASGTYHVLASHDYLEAGTYQISTTINDGTNQITVPGTVVVSPAVFASTFKPAGLTATALDSSQVELTWADVPMLNAVGSTGVALDISTSPNFSSVVTKTLSSHVTAYVASGLSASTPYYFRIRSNGMTDVPESETATATTKASGSPAAPTITAAATDSLDLTGKTLTLSMTATASGSDTLSYSWQPVEIPFNAPSPTFPSGASNEQTLTVTLQASGTYVFRGIATDVNDSLSVTSDVMVNVVQVPTSIAVTPTVAGVAAGHTRRFTAVEDDQFGLPILNQPTISWSQSGNGSITPTGAIATYTAPSDTETATITASATLVPSATAIVSVTPATTGAPTVSFQLSPAPSGGNIDQDTSVTGIVDSPGDNITSWVMQVFPVTTASTGVAPITIATGTTEIGDAALGSSGYAFIGTINPTLIQQGLYNAVLTANYNNGSPQQQSSGSQQISITSPLQLGNFHLPVTDLTINTPGIPITISRVYDSNAANQNDGDFGPGWKLDLPDVTLSTTAFHRGTYDSSNGEDSLPILQAGDEVFVTLPDGTLDAFAFEPTYIESVNGYNIYTPTWVPLNGGQDQLTTDWQYDNSQSLGYTDLDSQSSDPSSSEIHLRSTDGKEFWVEYQVDSIGDTAPFDYTPFFTGSNNPDNARPDFGGVFHLSTQQGLTYDIAYNSSNGRWSVSRVTDGNGNYVDYSQYNSSATSHITAYNSANQQVAQVTLNRDTSHGNRISSIIDPNGGTITYGYDINGNLTSVTQRDNEGISGRDVTTYIYKPGTSLITNVVDSLGANLFTATYDVNGGLTQLSDIYNNPVPIHVTQANASTNQIETTTDLLGHTVEEVYDPQDQLLREVTQVTDPLNPAVLRDSVVVYQYDGDSGRITLQSNPFFSDNANALTVAANATESTPPPNGWQTDQSYDGHGNIQTSKDILTSTNTQTTTYSGYFSYSVADINPRITDPSIELLGKPGTITDASGATTTLTYDGFGNLQTSTDGTGQETEYDHNSAGQVTNTNRDFNSTLQVLSTNAYNSSGQLSSTTDFNYLPNGTQSGSVVHNFIYDGNWNQTLSYYYNSTNNQTVVDRTDYDADDRVKSTEHYVLTGDDSFTSASQLNSDTPLTTTSDTYNADGKLATSTDQFGGITYFDYDVKGNLIRTVNPDGTEVRSVYDVLGRLLLQTDSYYTGATSLASPNNTIAARSTLYVYDQSGRVIEIDRIDNAVVAIAQDPAAPAGINYGSWNGVGSLISRALTTYNSAGQVGAQVGTDWQTTTYAYFQDGKIETQTDALGDVTSYAYSVNTTNHTTSTAATDAKSHTTTTTYDADGRVINVTYNDGSFITTTYTTTATGQTDSQSQQAPAGTMQSSLILTNSLYDINGRLVEVDEPNPTTPTSSTGKLVTTYGYDIYGDETSQTDANGHITTFTYDSEGRQTSETLPGGTLTESTTYDNFGRESQSTDFDGNVTIYDYFNSGVSAGQLEDEKFFTPGQSLGSTPNEETADAYNNLQQLATVTQYSAGTVVQTTAYTYDKDDDETSELVTIPGSGTTQQLYHVYDQATDRLIETYTGSSNPASATTDIHYGYDALGRLASVTEYRIDGAATATDTLGSHSMYNASGSITTTNLPNTVYTYDASGNLQSEILPDGITQTYGYDTLNRLTSETVTEGSANIASFTYSLSTDGKRMSETDNQYNTSGTLLYTNTFNWGYDGDNRLTSETLTAGSGSPDASYTDTYQYDSVGNRTQKVHTVGSNVTTIAYTYDSNGDDRLMTETATGAGAYTTNYTYDNNGSLESVVRTGTGATTSNYTYDVQNRLVTAIVGGATTTYTYDANGNRVSSTQDSTTTYDTIDDYNPTGYTQILEQATSFGGTPSMTYVVGQAVLGQANSSGVLSYLVTDGHGSTRILADARGGITSRFDYDAFGNALISTSGTQILYAGQFLDAATGLYDLRARNYDPIIGRFISADTFAGYLSDPISLESFLYAADNPANYVDLGGHQLDELLVDIGIDGAIEIGHAIGTVGLGAEEGTFTYEAAEEYSTFIEELANEVGAPRFTETEADALAEQESNILENAANGIRFQQQALGEAGISPETETFTETINGQDVTTRPDSYEEGVEMTEVKNVNYQPYTKQLQAQIAKAKSTDTPYTLIIRGGQNATTLSKPLISALKSIGATVLQFNPPAVGFTPFAL